MAKKTLTRVRQPPVIGELIAGVEALLVVSAPVFVLLFCVVHTLQVQGAMRTLQAAQPEEVVSVWTVITNFVLLVLSFGFSCVGTFVLVFVTGLGVVVWRLVAWGVGYLGDVRSKQHYRALAGEVVMEKDAWSTPMATEDDETVS